VDGAAVRAARQVREVAREPKELQLERERERIDCRSSLGACRKLVQQVEEARQRVESARVRLLLREQPQHRLGADQPDTQRVGLLADPVMRVAQVDAGDGLQLARPLVEHQLDVGQRLEPRAEARLRFADPLRDGADTPARECVQVQHPVGLPEAERAQHDRLGLVAPSGHDHASLLSGVGGTSAGDSAFTPWMARVQVYSTRWRGYCVRAKALLESRGIEYEELSLDGDPAFRRKLFDLTGGWTVPQILVDGRPI